MKKTCVVLVLILSVVGAYAQSGVIKELTGTVELKGPAAAAFATAKAGDEVREDTVISTGFKSTAIVEVGSALLAVRPLTRLTLTEIRASAGNEALNVNLQAGRVRVDLNPPVGTRASLTVSSPAATASVRGTSFEFDTRNLNVNYGAVSFRGSRGREYVVYGGAGSGVSGNGMALDPVGQGRQALSPPRPGSSGGGGGNTVTSPVGIGGGAAEPSPGNPGNPGSPSSPSTPNAPNKPHNPYVPSKPGTTGTPNTPGDGDTGINVDFQ